MVMDVHQIVTTSSWGTIKIHIYGTLKWKAQFKYNWAFIRYLQLSVHSLDFEER